MIIECFQYDFILNNYYKYYIFFNNFNNFIQTYKGDSPYTIKAYFPEHTNTCLSLSISQFLHLTFTLRQVANPEKVDLLSMIWVQAPNSAVYLHSVISVTCIGGITHLLLNLAAAKHRLGTSVFCWCQCQSRVLDFCRYSQNLHQTIR